MATDRTPIRAGPEWRGPPGHSIPPTSRPGQRHPGGHGLAAALLGYSRAAAQIAPQALRKHAPICGHFAAGPLSALTIRDLQVSGLQRDVKPTLEDAPYPLAGLLANRQTRGHPNLPARSLHSFSFHVPLPGPAVPRGVPKRLGPRRSPVLRILSGATRPHAVIQPGSLTSRPRHTYSRPSNMKLPPAPLSPPQAGAPPTPQKL